MSTFNNGTTEVNKDNRNLLALFGGGAVLLVAVYLLIFGGTFAGDTEMPEPEPLAGARQPAETVTLPTSGPPLMVGDRPYEFALSDLDGNSVTLSQFIGRPILVNFWATWCGPCRIEMPEIQASYEAYRDQGLVVLALDQDETAADVRAYFEELGLTFTPLLDNGSETAKKYGLQGTLPTSVFINPEGEVTAIHRGVMTRGQIETFLAETIPGKTAS